ncbi:hypothetical protein ACHAWF_014033 [Thalassiosira exigua]
MAPSTSASNALGKRAGRPFASAKGDNLDLKESKDGNVASNTVNKSVGAGGLTFGAGFAGGKNNNRDVKENENANATSKSLGSVGGGGVSFGAGGFVPPGFGSSPFTGDDNNKRDVKEKVFGPAASTSLGGVGEGFSFGGFGSPASAFAGAGNSNRDVKEKKDGNAASTSPGGVSRGFSFGWSSAFAGGDSSKRDVKTNKDGSSPSPFSPNMPKDKLFGSAPPPSFSFEPPAPAPKKKVSRASLRNKAPESSLEGYEHYREFMDKLAESGVDDYIDLPMIAVMGDTSSGKSSLLSSISLVELPSSDTLTTRCPIRLQMRNADVRTARVKVVWKDKPTGDDADFVERTVEEQNWNDITDIIAKAQAHIIDKSGREVSRSIVCVDMKGPHCENLTLIDLPGIVRATGKGESSTLAEDVDALMRDYLNNERCVILAVHPSNVDFHNSQILAEAKKVDPETKRTIPVLTKPDLIDEGAESTVQDLLLGKVTDKFEMGFHMVKGRGQKDLNEDVGIEDGLEKEEAFFRNKEVWRKIEDKSKFGTKNLRVKLAGLQMKLIHASFKSIISEMKDRRDDAVIELKSLGDIPSSLREKRALFRTVREEMREGLGAESLNGRISQLHSSENKRPSAAFHLASKDFQDELSSSKLANISSIKVGTEIIAISSGREVRGSVCFMDENEDYVYLAEEWSKIKTFEAVELSKLTLVRDKIFVSNKGSKVYMAGSNPLQCYELRPISRKLARCDPQWIHELIEQNRPYSLPIFLNPDLFDAIVADQIENEWKEPSLELLQKCAGLMETRSENFINEMSMIKSLPSLREYLVRKSSEVVETHMKETEIELSKFLHRERSPYTQNHYLFENLSKLRTQRLMDEVLSSVARHTQPESTDHLSSAIRDIFERNQKKSISDHMAEEMMNALDSYGKVALKRFVDTVPMICIQIMKRFPKVINDILLDVTDDEIDQLVSAPPGAIMSVDALKKEIKTLEKGIDTVKGLSSSGGMKAA